MACHGCTQSFGFLNKEVGCPTCGFSYCKKCLKFKLSDDEVQKLIQVNLKSDVKPGTSICRACHDKVNSKIDQAQSFKDAAKLIRNLHRLESLENPSKPPITLYRETSNSRLDKLKPGLSEADEKILQRLVDLRESGKSQRRKSDQMDEDVEARLARLRGEDIGASGGVSNKDVLLSQKPETEMDLMKRLGQQVGLEKKYNEGLVSDLEERLAKLRPNANAAPRVIPNEGEMPSNQELDVIINSDDEDDEGLSEEEQVQRLINKFKAEAALEAKLGKPEPAEDGIEMDFDAIVEFEDDDYDNYCELCNENRATLKCNSCDGDVFCKKCFHEFHVEIGEIHKSTPL